MKARQTGNHRLLGCSLGAGVGVAMALLLRQGLSGARRKVAAPGRDSERALRASEKRLRTLVAATFEGIAISEGGRFQDVNEQLGRMLGYACEELVGKEVAAVIVPEDRSRVLANLQAERESCIEHEMLRKDGTRITVEAHGQTIEVEGHRVRYTALRDITEQKRAERALRESEAKYRQLVDLLPTAVYACNCEGSIWFYNEQAVALWGCRPQPGAAGTQFCGCLQALTAEGRAVPPEGLPLAQACRHGRSLRNVEGIIERRDGSHAHVQVNIDPVRESGGEVVGAISVLTDISERKRTERALQTQNHRLSLLNEAAAHLLLAERPEQVMAGIYERMAGYFQTSSAVEFEVSEAGDELSLTSGLGEGEPKAPQGLTRFKMGEGIVGRVAQQRHAMVLGQVQESAHSDTAALRGLGVRAYACYPLVAGERLLGTLAFASRQRERFAVEDLEFFETLASYLALARERLRLRQELQRHAAQLEQAVTERTSKLRELVAELEHMSYSMIHDLRAPLRAIQSYAALIAEEQGEGLLAESREMLRQMVSATNRMDQLITGALNYNRAVREQLVLARVEVGPLLRGLLGSYLELQPTRAEVRLEGEFPPVLGNEAALAQCFSNLLNNAVKFVAPGVKPQVRIYAERRSAEGSTADARTEGRPAPAALVRIWVADNGTGVPTEGQERIFQMFQRMHGPEYEGTGIGLALVRKLMERMDGRVGVESEAGKGSRFWVELRAAAT